MKFSVVSLLLFLPAVSFSATPNAFVGRDVCAGCHKSIADTQRTTAMARTWQGKDTTLVPQTDTERHAEGPDPAIQYLVRRTATEFQFNVQVPGHETDRFPIETTMGGQRHGLSFLFRVPSLNGSPLARAPLVEGRYLHYAPENKLERSPGFPEEKPANYETAFGRVLTPGFEKKCLTCHGEPRTVASSHKESGVTCESCHGAGQQHLAAIAAHSADKQILNPRKQPIAEQSQACAQCHSGFSVVEDPLPHDLLISDQVTALQNAECFRQSGGHISCTNCHDPHQDAPRAVLVQRSEATCLGCHSVKVSQHASVCPVNQKTGCVGCHMPDQTKPPLRVADHWIRVRPEKSGPVQKALAEWRTEVQPKHIYLRMIAVSERDKAESLREQIAAGGSFFDLARANSQDSGSARNGGYLGDLRTEQLPAAWAQTALALEPGELSQAVETGGSWLILQRLPRGFREDAEAHYNRAMDLRKTGQREQSAAELLEALKIYPQLLRALTYLGVTYGEAGNPQAGAAILSVATHLYPQDAGAHFNLGVALGALNDSREVDEYKSALSIDPDLVSAYLNWGAALYAKGQYREAIELYRQGIQVNPLVASLHYSLSIALQQQGDKAEAQKELELAQKIDPNLAK
jgi:predicted CXXCH cytochrome family protein